MQTAGEITKTLNGTAAAPADLRNRNHTLGPPKTVLGRLGLRLQNVIEDIVVRASILPDEPIYDTADFPWVAGLQANWRTIRAELDQVLVYREQMPSFHEILKEVGTITTDDTWKTFFLQGAGMDCTGNAARCPETMKLLAQIPGASTAFFSILSPGKHIPAHRGAYNGVLRFHLGLLVPEPRERCRIRIGNEFRNWNEGEALIFDDSYNHEVWNDTQGWRVVLFVDFPRPLRQPWHWLNRSLIGMGALAPFLREAGQKQKAWEKKFYKN
jgi:ornithine lipid ester-linked acyl 2-hydroxylase